MIISKTPFRISFCGGGTDLPSHYRKDGGCVVSTSIDKYVYITLAKSFHRNMTTLKYSTVEVVDNINFVKHPILREVLQSYNLKGLEINSTSNIPSGTGLGSSSTFTVGLVNAVRTYKNKTVSKEILANEACDIEINRLGEPIGQQDQYAAAYGGLNFISFNKDETVTVDPIQLSDDEKKKMSENLLMFYLGGTRSASNVIKSYNNGSTSTNNKMNDMSKLAIKLRDHLNSGDVDYLGKVLDEGWRIKRSLSENVSNRMIDDIYDTAINNGAVGGKLLGAGGNGFMLFYVEKDSQKSVRSALNDYRELLFDFDNTGSQIIFNDE